MSKLGRTWKMPLRTKEHTTNQVISRRANGLWHTQETKDKIRATCIARSIGKGRTHSIETRNLLSDMFRGSKGPNWKGGKSSLKKLIRESGLYKQWRSDVFRRDGWTCQTCGNRGSKAGIEAHHIVLLATLMDKYMIKTIGDAMQCEELWDINNGVTLCKICHDMTKKGAGFEIAKGR